MAKTGRQSFQFMLRLPDDLREDLKSAADKSGRSVTAEIIDRLEGSFRNYVYLPARLERRVERDAARNQLSYREQLISALEKIYPGGMALGEFLENQVLPAALESVAEARKRLIGIANMDHEAVMTGLFVEELQEPNGTLVLVVYQSDGDPNVGQWEVARIVVTAAHDDTP